MAIGEARREEEGGAWEKGIKREAGEGGEEEMDREREGREEGQVPQPSKDRRGSTWQRR